MLVERHEAFRTSYPTVLGESRRAVRENATVPVIVHDCRGGDWAGIAAAKAREPFDLANGPLVRIDVFETGTNDITSLSDSITSCWTTGPVESLSPNWRRPIPQRAQDDP